MPPFRKVGLMNNPMLISATGSYKLPEGGILKHKRDGNFKEETGITNNEKIDALFSAVGDAASGKTTLLNLEEHDGESPKLIKIRPAREKGWALVSVSDLDIDPSEIEASILEQLFGLTPTECAVAFALLEHEKLSDVAEARKVSVETIRMHVKNIFMKTGISSQKKLLSLLTRIHAMTNT